MAERRMFSKTIIDSDMFLDMPATTQNLYFHLAMRADDDGFINSPQRLMRSLASCTKNDMDVLVLKQFVVPFESGVCVIRHWRIHNYLRADRYKETMHLEEKNQLTTDVTGAYTPWYPGCQPIGIPGGVPAGNPGKVRLGKVSKEKKKKEFVPPTVEQVHEYCTSRNNGISAERFIDYYAVIGWVVGRAKKPMKDWKAAVHHWERMEKQRNPAPAPAVTPESYYNRPKVSDEDLENMPRG